MAKINFSDRINGIFTAMNTDYDGINRLMQDVALHKEIFDEESGRVISRGEANAKILDFSRQVLNVDEDMLKRNAKQARRNIRDNARQWFDIIEDTVDLTVTVGLQENEWFNTLVDSRQIGYHDRLDFEKVENDAFLAVAKAGTSHHDHIIQRLAAGERISVNTDLYVVKVGADINRYIAGQEDWNKLVDAISKAFIQEIQSQIYAEVSSAASSLPVTSGFVSSGTLSNATKVDFDAIIENVSMANNGADVVIFGSRSALSKISALADVDWAANGQKESMMNTGNIGIYEGTRLVVMPNRFKDADMTTTMFPTNKLLILPSIGDEGKFVKFVDEGDTQIVEKNERGEYVSDLMTYEVQRRFGVATIIGRQFGQWTLS